EGNENTKKPKPRCYFLSSVVLCIFSSLCCFNKRKTCANTPIARQSPADSIPETDLCCSCFPPLRFLHAISPCYHVLNGPHR
ncbi:hypothetical protein XENOCAPTIV_029048, partial [Xenoophorus captivus]